MNIIKGIKSISNVKYLFDIRNGKLNNINNSSKTIKAISINANAFIRKNNDDFVIPTITIDNVIVNKNETSEFKELMKNISGYDDNSFLLDCENILAKSEKYTELVEKKIDNIINNIKEFDDTSIKQENINEKNQDDIKSKIISTMESQLPDEKNESPKYKSFDFILNEVEEESKLDSSYREEEAIAYI